MMNSWARMLSSPATQLALGMGGRAKRRKAKKKRSSAKKRRSAGKIAKTSKKRRSRVKPNKLKKGSAAAKAYMAKIRKMRKK